MLPISVPLPAQQVSIRALWSIAVRMAWRSLTLVSGALALLKDRTTSPFVVPWMTWYLLLPSNCLSVSGACTVPMTLMVPVSNALLRAVASLKYLRTTVEYAGCWPQ